MKDPPQDPNLTQRFDFLRRLGEGPFGETWLVQEAGRPEPVVLKVFEGVTSARECAALRRLDHPGVVRFLGEGVNAQGSSYVLLAYVDADPFPGDTPHSELAALTYDALEALTAVHDQGLVHADLKPSNILARQGRATLLDFNLSHARAQSTSRLEGTLRYMAPEVLRHAPPTSASDLFSFGLMVLEALGHPLDVDLDATLVEVRRARLGRDPRALLPGVEPPWREWLFRMLAPEPSERPKSAAHAQALLSSGHTTWPDTLPWVGADTWVKTIAHRLLHGERVIFEGREGVGKSRAVQRLRRELGVSLLEIGASTGVPLESLRACFPDIDVSAETSLQELQEQLSASLEETVRAGIVPHVTSWESLDPWSQRVLQTHRGPSIVECRERTSLEGERVPCAPWTDATLEALFEGPELGFAFRSRGARALWRRTGGVGARVRDELSRWVDAGLATRTPSGAVRLQHGDLMRIERGACTHVQSVSEHGLSDEVLECLAWLELLSTGLGLEIVTTLSDQPRWMVEANFEALERAGLLFRPYEDDAWVLGARTDVLNHRDAGWRQEASRRALTLLPSTHEARARVARSSGQIEVAVEEGLAHAERLDLRGRSEEASLVCESLATLTKRGALWDRVLMGWSKIALATGTPEGLEVLCDAMQQQEVSDELERVRALLEVAAMIQRSGGGADVLARLEALGPFEDPDFELRRGMYRFHASFYRSEVQALRVLDELEAWSQEHPQTHGSVLGWRASTRYQHGDYAQAAVLHERAAAHKRRASAKLSSLINASLAHIDALDYERAALIAQDAGGRARAALHIPYELQALVAERAARYRSREAMTPALELLEATAELGNRELDARAALGEAVIARREGEFELSFTLAERALTGFEHTRHVSALWLTRALLVHLGQRPVALLRDTPALPPRVNAQVRKVLGEMSGAREDLDAFHRARQACDVPEDCHLEICAL